MDSLMLGITRDLKPSTLSLRMANRHGLVAGATGTGKTVTLQSLAEQFSEAGVPVFATDVKGDLSGIGHKGVFNEALRKRAHAMGIKPYRAKAYPVKNWDLFGKRKFQIQARVSSFGPLLMSRMLNLTPTQEGAMNVVFLYAERQGLPLCSLDDMRDVLNEIRASLDWVSGKYGYVSKSTLDIILRGLTSLEMQGGGRFFGEDELDLDDMMQVNEGNGLGIVNLFSADTLMERPYVYAAFIMWLMQKMLRELPEVGDPEKPRMVFFFDEAHLLFRKASEELLIAVEQAVKLIRSKGVGIYFVTQSPLDVPESVLGQLGNKVQHALRAFTPKDQKAVKTAADTFRKNPALSTQEEIMLLGKGMALVSTLREDASPSVVEVVSIRPPRSYIGAVEPVEDEDALSIEEGEGKRPESHAEPTQGNAALGCAVIVGFLLLLGWLITWLAS